MSIYRVINAGHGLSPGDLLFGGEYFQTDNSMRQIRFHAYGERGEEKYYVFLPRTWLVENVELSIDEERRGKDSVQEREFINLLRGRGRDAYRIRQQTLPSRSDPSLPRPSWADDAQKLGRLLAAEDKSGFRGEFERWLNQVKSRRTQKGKIHVIVLSDRMSGDSRLVGLYASYMNYPILYLITISNIGRPDFTAQYLEELGIPLLRCAVQDTHETYLAFQNSWAPHTVKATSITGEVAKILQTPAQSNKPYSRESFVGHARTQLHSSAVPRDVQPLLDETRPALVLWTKSRAVPNLFKGRPEHLLGNTGTAQILQIAKYCGFATAIAGDLPTKPVHQQLIDYDLRFTGGALAGLSLREQYGIFKVINVYTPMVHIAMRSGQVEPLPLLGMRTIYLEELGSKQGPRMQQLATATSQFYSRHQFLLPPTLKGRFREAVSYFFDHNVRMSLKATRGQKAMEEILNAVVRHLGDTRGPYNTDQLLENRLLWEYMSSLSPEESNESFARFKTLTSREQFPRGFDPEDLEALKSTLTELKVQAMLILGFKKIQAISAALNL